MSRPTLRQFITDCLLVRENADVFGVKECTGFALVHERGATQVPLKTVNIGAKQWDPKELADLFEGVAETFAGGVPGTQQFQVLAFFDKQDTPQAFYPLRKNGEQDHHGISTEAPTKDGITSQLMRHNEALTRINAGQTATLFGIMTGIIQRQDERIFRLEREQHEVIELSKNLVMETAANEHGRAVEILKLQQSAKDRETAIRLLPPVVNRILGKEIFPQAVADTAIIEQLAESLDVDQIEKLAAVLRPEQLALLMDRFVQVMEKKKKQQDEAEEAKKRGGPATQPAQQKPPEAAE